MSQLARCKLIHFVIVNRPLTWPTLWKYLLWELHSVVSVVLKRCPFLGIKQCEEPEWKHLLKSNIAKDFCISKSISKYFWSSLIMTPLSTRGVVVIKHLDIQLSFANSPLLVVQHIRYWKSKNTYSIYFSCNVSVRLNNE